MSGWTQADVTRHQLKQQQIAKPSKYRNVKTTVNGETFDSKHEAAIWQELCAREKAGEIAGVRRQSRFPLRAPVCIPGPTHGAWVQVAEYVADFTYYSGDGFLEKHVVDAKSKATRTQTYRLKAKWLELQDGIIIEEV